MSEESLAAPTGVLKMWVIYWNPIEYPGKAVARRWIAGPKIPVIDPDSKPLIGRTVEELRGLMPVGLYRMERSPGDDPSIVEVWM